MSIIKSYAVGNGDMFYIEHNSDNLTIIDCCLNDEIEDNILDEISFIQDRKNIVRVISTHPDDDHIRGLERLDDKISIRNFYCVKNAVIKKDVTDSFTKYCELRDSEKAFFLEKGSTRKWMNKETEERGSAGIQILWPDLNNNNFKTALANAEKDASPNNISPIIIYRTGKITALWMGDLESDFMQSIETELDLPKVTLLFAPHHGRYSGKIPWSLLKTISPKITIIGEAPSENLHYYDGYNTITQNTAGNILFDCKGNEVHVFTSNEYKANFLTDYSKELDGYYYIGTLCLED
jgi:beta-lactamase superfamily II metal-dependent hydrolase